MNTNIAKLQAQLQGLSPQQIQMAVQGGSVPPWLAAVEQQRRMDLSKRTQSATPPRSTVVQDMQGIQGVQAYADGGGVRSLLDQWMLLEDKKRKIMESMFAPVESEGRMGISTSINEPSNVPPTATIPPDPTLITPNETPLTNDLQNWAYGSPEAAAAAQPNPELTAGLRQWAKNVPPTAAIPPDPTLITPASQTGIGQLNADGGGLPPDIIAKQKELQAMEESLRVQPPDIIAKEKELQAMEESLRVQKATLRAQKATEEATRPIAGQLEAEEAAGLAALNEYRKQHEDAAVQEDAAVLAAKQAEAAKNQAGWDAYRNANRGRQGIQQASDLYARGAAQGAQQAQPQAQPLPIKEQLSPIQQAVVPMPLNAPEEDAGIAKLAQTPPQAPARVSTPEQTYAATATPDSYSQGLAKLRKAMEIDNPMPEIRTKESEKNVKEREAQRQDVEDNNLGWSVMQAAAAMMAGDSPYASVNIGQGALAGLQKYAEGKKTIRDLGKDINALQADRETALNSRDYQKYTQKQNQLAMMTELAERAQQAELQRQSVEGIHQLDRESAERMAKDRNAATLKAAGLRGAGSGGGNLDDYLRTASSLVTAETNIDKEFNDQKNIINADGSLSKDEKAVAIMQLERATNARKAEIIGMREAMKARAGIPTIGGAGVINTGDLPPSVKPLPPEKGEARSNGKPTWADYNNLVKERDRLYELKNKGTEDPTEYKNIEAEIKKIEAEINRIHPLIPR